MVNWDNVLAYDTFKIVRVRDKYLGGLKLLLMSLIFLYILVKVVVIDKSYYIHDSPGGSVRISLQAPRGISMSDEAFCPNNPKYIPTCTAVEGNSWPYTAETCLGDTYPTIKGSPIACQIWDEHDSRYPADEQNSIFIATRIISERQKYKCGKENSNKDPKVVDQCTGSPYESDNSEEGVFFLAGVKNYTLGIQHTFFGQSSPFSSDIYRGNSRGFPGKIVMDPHNQSNVREFPASKSDTPDIITVGELLKAADVDLASPSKDPKNSLLYSGTVVLILVKYTNDDGWAHPRPTDPRYEYVVKRVTDSDYKMFETKAIPNESDYRHLIKRAGPKFIFLVTGDFAQFSFQTLLIQLASAIGLLSIASLVVEQVMLKIMKWRKHYAAAKFEETNDFSSLYDGDELQQSQSASANGDGGTYAAF